MKKKELDPTQIAMEVLMPTIVQEEIIKTLHHLDDDQQERVLAYLNALSNSMHGSTGQDLIKIQGTIASDDLSMMQHAIDMECDRIDYGEW